MQNVRISNTLRDIWLIVLAIIIMAAGVFFANWTSELALRRDATNMAMEWTDLLIKNFRSVRTQDGEVDRGTHVEMISKQLLAAFQAHAPASAAESEESEVMNDPGVFHRGRFVGHIYRYAIFGRDGSILAKSGRFENYDELDMSKAAGGAREFEAAALRGEISSKMLPQHIQRVFVPYRAGDSIPYVVAVDVDQYGAATLLSGAMKVVFALTALLMIAGCGIPALVAHGLVRKKAAAENQIRYLAYNDSLTDMPNRYHLTKRLSDIIKRVAFSGEGLAIYCVDLDRFKVVNDTLGHAIGDMLLTEVANRMKLIAGKYDIVGRVGGDEFLLVSTDIKSAETAATLAVRICSDLTKPYELDSHEIAITASVGIALIDSAATTPEQLLTNADLALNRAKKDGRNTFRFFETAMDEAWRYRRQVENDLHSAIPRKQLRLHYQPQYSLATGALKGYEALIRWQHPERGLVPPDKFISVAEEVGLIWSFGEWVLETACEYAATWPENLTVAVNLSPVQFGHGDVLALVKRVLDETGLNPSRLELEITESLLLNNAADVLTVLRQLRDLGITIAMDDFGTGYSSLSYLTQFPINKIKIDRSFIKKLNCDDASDAIVCTIIGLGKSLEVEITAEGVEDEAQAEFLATAGCDQVQGYLFGRPRESVSATDLRIRTDFGTISSENKSDVA